MLCPYRPVSRETRALDIRGKRLLVIGGAGLIGSHVVDLLTQEDVGEVIIYDNFVLGRVERLEDAHRYPVVSVFEIGGRRCTTEVGGGGAAGGQGRCNLG